MNWNVGLKRVSAVAIGATAALLAFIGAAENHFTALAIGGFAIGCLVGAVAIHKTISWVIDGFTQR
jgi:murein endopeptidase